MPNDDIFRFILILGAVVVFPIGIYHRLRSQASGERLNRRAEGIFILVTLRPIGVAAVLGLFAYMINPAWMQWSSLPLPTWLRWMGVGLGIPAAVLIIATLLIAQCFVGGDINITQPVHGAAVDSERESAG